MSYLQKFILINFSTKLFLEKLFVFSPFQYSTCTFSQTQSRPIRMISKLGLSITNLPIVKIIDSILPYCQINVLMRHSRVSS